MKWTAHEDRFKFGENWWQFLSLVDEQRIEVATESLRQMLDIQRLDGGRFLDIGSGSGLFSLAARRLGAHVHSFDYDLQSVACAQELKRRYCTDDPAWIIDQGSILDEAYVRSLGQFDIVYSWGVLHHTGAMWQALENVTPLVRPGGKLFVAIYNDQDRISRHWLTIKRAYNRGPAPVRAALLWLSLARLWTPTVIRDGIRGNPLRSWRAYARESRSMSPWRDMVDWVGGYPFEVAKPEEIFDFYRERGYVLRRLKTQNGHGCNEFTFIKTA